jgi:tRNA pseudouridine55 synthase
MQNDGIILVNKKKDWTSRDVVNRACKLLGTKKIGHCGTLDPFATGVLILGVNKGTKLLQFLESSKKKYVAKLKLGLDSETLDITGKNVVSVPYQRQEKSKIIEVLQSFLGKSQQLTPKYSARKIDGKKLYEYAREGIEVEDIYREIEVFQIDLISYEDDTIIFIAEVSKGTYIRQLGADIAKKLGTSGILEDLDRISIGDFHKKNAIDIEEVIYEKIYDYHKVLDFMPTLKVDGDLLKQVSNGMTIRLYRDEENILIKSKDDKNLAIYYKFKNGLYKCLRGL